MKRKIVFKDIEYSSNTYNPEGLNHSRSIRYIIDGDGREKVYIEEPIEEKDNNLENGQGEKNI